MYKLIVNSDPAIRLNTRLNHIASFKAKALPKNIIMEYCVKYFCKKKRLGKISMLTKGTSLLCELFDQIYVLCDHMLNACPMYVAIFKSTSLKKAKRSNGAVNTTLSLPQKNVLEMFPRRGHNVCLNSQKNSSLYAQSDCIIWLSCFLLFKWICGNNRRPSSRNSIH